MSYLQATLQHNTTSGSQNIPSRIYTPSPTLKRLLYYHKCELRNTICVMGGNSDRCDVFLCLFICESTDDNQPVLPQHKDPKRAQSLNASHFRDVIVIQVQENKLLQM